VGQREVVVKTTKDPEVREEAARQDVNQRREKHKVKKVLFWGRRKADGRGKEENCGKDQLKTRKGGAELGASSLRPRNKAIVRGEGGRETFPKKDEAAAFARKCKDATRMSPGGEARLPSSEARRK